MSRLGSRAGRTLTAWRRSARAAPLHRERRGGRAARARAARAPDRLRPRPAGAGSEGVLLAARADAADRPARRGAHRRHGSGRARGRRSASDRRSTASRARWRRECRSSARRSSPTTAATPSGSGPTRRPAPSSERRLLALPGIGEMKAKTLDGCARQAVRRPAAGLGGRGAEPSDARRRRLDGGAPRLPGEEARLQGLPPGRALVQSVRRPAPATGLTCGSASSWFSHCPPPRSLRPGAEAPRRRTPPATTTAPPTVTRSRSSSTTRTARASRAPRR